MNKNEPKWLVTDLNWLTKVVNLIHDTSLMSKCGKYESLAHAFGNTAPVWETDLLKRHLSDLIDQKEVCFFIKLLT
jgi:hypothetical protein